jgi:hypothetical protein
MSGAKKVYVHLGDLVHLMIVPECFTRDASGYKEQLYPQSTLIRLHDTNRIAIADPLTRLVQWDGNDMPSRPDPHAIARAALEKAAKAAERYASFPQPTSRAARYHEAHNVKANIAAAIRALANDPAALAEIVKGVKG